MSKKSTAWILALLFVGVAAAATAGAATIELGNAGELYEIVGGRYGDVFPEGDEHAAKNPVLALAVTRSDAQRELFLVPGTGSGKTESAASLFYDRARGSLVALWRSGAADAAVLLNVATFEDGGFSHFYEIEDPTLASAGPPRIALTRDRYEIQLSETEWESIERTIVHLLWAAHDGAGVDVRYSALIFVEGIYSGWNQVISLRDTTADPESPPAFATDEAFLKTLGLSVSEDGQRVVASFVNSLDAQLQVVDIGILPLELSYLGEEIREGLLGLAGSFASDDLSSYADNGRLEIDSLGRRHRMHPALVDYIAEEVVQEILVIGGQYTLASYSDLVEHLRAFTLETAAPLVTSSTSYARTASGSIILEVDVGNLNLGATGPPPLINLRVLRSLEAPVIGGGQTRLFASPDGRHVLVSWDDGEGRLSYVENEAGGWSEPRSLILGESLPAERAYDVLERRVR